MTIHHGYRARWPWLDGERDGADKLIEFAERFGYGRAIQILQEEWSEKLQLDERWPHQKRTADIASGLICVWCKTDRRTGKKSSPLGGGGV